LIVGGQSCRLHADLHHRTHRLHLSGLTIVLVSIEVDRGTAHLRDGGAAELLCGRLPRRAALKVQALVRR
jgi:hypothetical protein